MFLCVNLPGVLSLEVFTEHVTEIEKKEDLNEYKCLLCCSVLQLDLESSSINNEDLVHLGTGGLCLGGW